MKKGKPGVLSTIAKILDALNETGMQMTDLTYRTKLDPHKTAAYLSILLELKLIRELKPSYFIITEKGQDFLEQYKPVRTF